MKVQNSSHIANDSILLTGDDILSMDPNFTPFPDFSDSQNEFWIDEEGRE